MSKPLVLHSTPNGVIMTIPVEGHIMARGTTVPADGTTGYAKGCIFIDTNANAGSVFYVNEGTIASSDFNVAL